MTFSLPNRVSLQEFRRICMEIQERLYNFFDITLSTDGTMAANSDSYVATQKATVTYTIAKSIGTAARQILGFSASATPVVYADVCHIKTGTYTGDGSTGTAITGVGFQPKVLWIFTHFTSEAGQTADFKMDTTWGDYSIQMLNNAGNDFYSLDSKINSLDSGGFTVDDDGADSHPNKLNQVYDYVAWGT